MWRRTSALDIVRAMERSDFVSFSWVALSAALAGAACGDGDDAQTDPSGGSTAVAPASGTNEADTAADETTTSGTPDTGATGETSTGAEQDDNCAALAEGLVTDFMVGDTARAFVLNLPDGVEQGGPWAVVFNWHGLGDTAQNMAGLVSPHVNHPDMPFIAVTPEDTDVELAIPLLAGQSMDWDVFNVSARANLEVALFDEVLACLDDRYGVDPMHVHSMGFSLGGVTTDMLVSQRSDRIASVATYSGGYWNNEVNVGGLLGSVVTWPEFDVETQYAQLFMHGGRNDLFDLSVLQLHFDQYAVADSLFLNERGHDTVICDHGAGHSASAPGMGADRFIEFFAAHPHGTTESPYASGLPASFADYCAFGGKTTE